MERQIFPSVTGPRWLTNWLSNKQFNSGQFIIPLLAYSITLLKLTHTMSIRQTISLNRRSHNHLEDYWLNTSPKFEKWERKYTGTIHVFQTSLNPSRTDSPFLLPFHLYRSLTLVNDFLLLDLVSVSIRSLRQYYGIRPMEIFGDFSAVKPQSSSYQRLTFSTAPAIQMFGPTLCRRLEKKTLAYPFLVERKQTARFTNISHHCFGPIKESGDDICPSGLK